MPLSDGSTSPAASTGGVPVSTVPASAGLLGPSSEEVEPPQPVAKSRLHVPSERMKLRMSQRYRAGKQAPSARHAFPVDRGPPGCWACPMPSRMNLAVLSLVVAAGCGCPPTSPNAPAASPAERPKPPRIALPDMQSMGQCVDTPADVGLQMQVVDDMGVVTLSADAFIDLAPEQRMLAYHLSRAAVAAEPIIYEQRGRLGGTLKVVAEELALQRAAMPDALRAKVETFVRRVFVHKGVYDMWTGRKMSPPLDEAGLREALTAAVKAGAKLPAGADKDAVDEVVAQLRPLLFDPKVEPVLAVPPRPSIPGPHEKYLDAAVESLERAAKLAEGDTKASIEKLMRYLSSGDGAAFEGHVRAGADTSPLAMRVGFLDAPLAGPQLWAGVMLDDAARQPVMTKLADVLPEVRGVVFGSRSLVPVLPPRASIPLTLTGRASPVTPPASWLRGPTGPGQAFVWTPIVEAEVKLRTLAVKKGFVPDPARQADFERCLPHAYRTLFTLRAALGSPDTRSANALPAADRAVIERARSEAAAVVASWASPIVDAGLLPDAGCAQVVDMLVPADHLVRLGGLADGAAVGPDTRAGALIVHYALARGALREVHRDGHVHLQITEPERWRSAVRSLLDTLLGIEAGGDAARARALLAEHADPTDARWRASARERTTEAGLPARLVFVAPRLKAIRDAEGAITDATILDSLDVIETALIDAGKMPMP